jgi:hypothetical protein
LLLANFGREGNPQPISPNISQETLAEMIGTTRSRVSAFMNKFRKLGLISYNGQIEVHSSMLNAVLHEKPQLQERDQKQFRSQETASARGYMLRPTFHGLVGAYGTVLFTVVSQSS